MPRRRALAFWFMLFLSVVCVQLATAPTWAANTYYPTRLNGSLPVKRC